jgi:hypothetical protein
MYGVEGEIYRRAFSLPRTGVRKWVLVAFGAVRKYESVHSYNFHNGIQRNPPLEYRSMLDS